MPRQTVCILRQSLGYLVILNPPTLLLHTLSQTLTPDVLRCVRQLSELTLSL